MAKKKKEIVVEVVSEEPSDSIKEPEKKAKQPRKKPSGSTKKPVWYIPNM